MNICVDAREFTRDRKTGISRYLETFLPAILDKSSKCRVTLLTNDNSAIPETILKFNPNRITLPSAPTVYTDQIILPQIAEKEKTDLFFSPYYKTPLSGRFKRVITVHDIMFLRLKEENPFKKILSGLQLRLSATKADAILVDSEYTRKDLIRYIPESEQKISILYPTLAANWSKPPESSRINFARTKFAGGKPYFLYVGNFKPHKNVDLLVKAFSELIADSKSGNHCLILAGGDDSNMERIVKLAGAALSNGSIKIYSNITDSELQTLYGGAEWFISASEYEGFGYPMLEAMLCGCPLICTNLTSIPEVTGNANIAISKPTREEVIHAIRAALSTSGTDRTKAIEKGRVTAEIFLSLNKPESILRVFDKLINS